MALLLLSTATDLARAQFATTSIYHFLFVPLTLGLGPIVVAFQTLWLRSRDERWLRLTRFFGTLFLINFAIGVATGLVQEFEFGMNWSVYSTFVGNVFGAPLAIEGLAAFFLESTFLGLWIFGWDRLSPRLHLATLYAAVAGSWLSAYFILVANSWMQHPVGSAVRNGQAVLTDVWALLGQQWTLYAFLHTILAGLTTAGAVVFGVACWQLLKGRDAGLFRRAAKVALVVLVPAATVNLWLGSHFGIVVTSQQPMKISATEAQWQTCTRCGFSLFQIGGFTEQDQTPSFELEIPGLLSYVATGSLNGTVQGLTPLQAQQQAQHGAGDYLPPVEAVYWSMRVMAYLGTLTFLLAWLGALFLWRGWLLRRRWALWAGVAGIVLPFVSCAAGWCLTELGRQPWIVQGLLKTVDAASPNVGTTWVATSLAVFVLLYALLFGLDVFLMRRYAGRDVAEPGAEQEPAPPTPAIGY